MWCRDTCTQVGRTLVILNRSNCRPSRPTTMQFLPISGADGADVMEKHFVRNRNYNPYWSNTLSVRRTIRAAAICTKAGSITRISLFGIDEYLTIFAGGIGASFVIDVRGDVTRGSSLDKANRAARTTASHPPHGLLNLKRCSVSWTPQSHSACC